MGDVSYSSNLGYKLIINYYETAHAKGPQDAAGAPILSDEPFCSD
jgi:hypothetical protein